VTGAGRLWGVGLGPGDPELITLKAARLIESADVIAYHQGVGKQSNARRIAAGLFPASVVEEVLQYPVTTGTTDHPGGYAGAMAAFYEECATRLGDHLEAGRDVVILAEGDPLFYGSYMYMHDRLADRFETEVVPGVPAFAAATAAVASPLVRLTDVLTILPGTLPEPELARRLADTDGAIIMKLGRTFPAVVSALRQAGRLDGALYVERASMPEQRWMPVADVDPTSVPYFSLIVVPGDTAPSRGGRKNLASSLPSLTNLDSPVPTAAEVLVIGLGPGPDRWITPEAVEVDRARLALDLALGGERVAVVSGGDAGIFGMAAAVFEAAEDAAYADVPIRVLPGLSAVQVVAARAGAPIGGDFAVMSLSDRLKPWDLIEKRLRAVAEADLVLAIYNPASRSRTTQVADAQRVLLAHRSPDTVLVVGRDVGRSEESLTVTTLGGLDPTTIDMKCLLIVGATGTRVTPAGQAWTPRSTP
jgi:precorrin-2 C20-methyltransferase/precorrin-3B C17-methyltransferase